MKTVLGFILGIIIMSLALYYVNIEDSKPEDFQLTKSDDNQEFYQELFLERQQIAANNHDSSQYIGDLHISRNDLILTGYYIDGSCQDWKGKWLNRHGISSKRDLLIAPLVQESLIKELSKYYLKNIEYYRLDRFNIPQSGLVAAMHLHGNIRVIAYLYNNKKDPEIKHTIEKFSKLSLKETSNDKFGTLDSLRQLYQELSCLNNQPSQNTSHMQVR